MSEHLHCRAHASLFDVSHMGQLTLHGETADAALERLVPGDIKGLGIGRQRYTVLLNEAGGIIDDLIVTRLAADRLFLVINAARREADVAHLRRSLDPGIVIDLHEDRALLALQGPQAATVLERLAPGAAALGFMNAGHFDWNGTTLLVARCGYTGEDGFELSVPAERAADLARSLLDQDEVGLAGLGARDSLRLEAGLPLWGSDIDELTTPIEAGLGFAVGKRRRAEGGFAGAAAILDQIAHGTHRVRVGILPDGRAPARASTAISDGNGIAAGTVTSGGFGPSIGGPISMGYVTRDLAGPGSAVTLHVRGRAVPARVTSLPFLPARARPARPVPMPKPSEIIERGA
jgi:aminomethyltransferase